MNAKPGTSMAENRRIMQEVNRNINRISGIDYNANIDGIPSVAQVHLWECHFFLLNTGTREREKDNRQGKS